ncbi:two-component regulator propeller domain-containing protein [Marinoscillum sp.]|uniref:two-component regulator propeller domain-containing protein n=1 Tax=Marinoscillum sp. TaxID=2024838 RepID=UPI003BAD26EA
MKWSCIIALCLGSLSQFATGQAAISEKVYTTRDGLASNTVYAVAQDNLGYIWFGTSRGLSRFDGQRFVNYDISKESTG